MNPPCPFFLAFLKTCEANRHPLRQVRMAWRIRRRSQKDELSCCSSFSRAHNENSSTIDSIIFGSMEWATNEWKFIKHPNYANRVPISLRILRLHKTTVIYLANLVAKNNQYVIEMVHISITRWDKL